jgi:hypothetical protein
MLARLRTSRAGLAAYYALIRYGGEPSSGKSRGLTNHRRLQQFREKQVEATSGKVREKIVPESFHRFTVLVETYAMIWLDDRREV